MLSIVVIDNRAPESAEPILSTSDPLIVGEVRRLLALRMSFAEADREDSRSENGDEDTAI
jgi:hypothetical protein